MMSGLRMSVRVVTICVASLVLTLVGVGILSGQSLPGDRGKASKRPPGPARVYQYVGVEQTIARVDMATGKIEILSQRRSQRASLLVEHSRPWQWREVAVRESNRREPELQSTGGDIGEESDATGP